MGRAELFELLGQIGLMTLFSTNSNYQGVSYFPFSWETPWGTVRIPVPSKCEEFYVKIPIRPRTAEIRSRPYRTEKDRSRPYRTAKVLSRPFSIVRKSLNILRTMSSRERAIFPFRPVLKSRN